MLCVTDVEGGAGVVFVHKSAKDNTVMGKRALLQTDTHKRVG